MSHGLFYCCPYYISEPGNITVALLSMEGQRALGFHQKYLNLCSEDEQRSYGFGMTWGWVINDRIFIFGWTIPVSHLFYFFIPWWKQAAKKVVNNYINVVKYSNECRDNTPALVTQLNTLILEQLWWIHCRTGAGRREGLCNLWHIKPSPIPLLCL